MQGEKNLYEYAVIRLVPKIERGEFLNVGLVMFCKKKRWLHMDFQLKPTVLASFSPDLDYSFIETNLKAFQEIAHGTNTLSPISTLEIAERFRWLTAVRSSILQTSRPHPGLSKNLPETFNQLFNELVL